MTALDSSDEYNDEAIANLIASLDLGDGPLSPATPPPRTPSPNPPAYRASAPRTLPSANLRSNPPPTTTTYYYESPTRSGYTTQWSRAGIATQGVVCASVHTVERAAPFPKTKKKAYVVFCGLRCGVVLTWPETRALVQNVRNSIFRGYTSVSDANAAFQYAQARSWTRVVNSTAVAPIPALPQPLGPDNDGANPLNGSEVLDDRWFVVYRGICPGVYRSHLECQLNTLGVQGAVHHSVVGKANALAAYAAATQRGDVGVVLPSYPAHQNPSTPSDPFL
ncbi:hypothetical protein B0H13DRAFT_1892770 [Mycena leptocephala]|nr:hypothetical protein B0H13DRAFT_1892770 [Mycena leptocephala]